MNKPRNHTHLKQKELEQIPSAKKTQLFLKTACSYVNFSSVCIMVSCEINYVKQYVSITGDVNITIQTAKNRKHVTVIVMA